MAAKAAITTDKKSISWGPAAPKPPAEEFLTDALEGPEVTAQLPALRERDGVQSLGVFGSFARGEQRDESDLDLLVEFDDRPVGLFQFIALEDELSDALGVKVDLVEKSALKPVIGRHVLAEVMSV